MSNLGRYQEIVIEASRAGGVDKLIRRVEAAAVAKALPRTRALWFGVGAVVTTCASLGWSYLNRRKEEVLRSGEEARSEIGERLGSEAGEEDPKKC